MANYDEYLKKYGRSLGARSVRPGPPAFDSELPGLPGPGALQQLPPPDSGGASRGGGSPAFGPAAPVTPPVDASLAGAPDMMGNFPKPQFPGTRTPPQKKGKKEKSLPDMYKDGSDEEKNNIADEQDQAIKGASKGQETLETKAAQLARQDPETAKKWQKKDGKWGRQEMGGFLMEMGLRILASNSPTGVGAIGEGAMGALEAKRSRETAAEETRYRRGRETKADKRAAAKEAREEKRTEREEQKATREEEVHAERGKEIEGREVSRDGYWMTLQADGTWKKGIKAAEKDKRSSYSRGPSNFMEQKEFALDLYAKKNGMTLEEARNNPEALEYAGNFAKTAPSSDPGQGKLINKAIDEIDALYSDDSTLKRLRRSDPDEWAKQKEAALNERLARIGVLDEAGSVRKYDVATDRLE